MICVDASVRGDGHGFSRLRSNAKVVGGVGCEGEDED